MRDVMKKPFNIDSGFDITTQIQKFDSEEFWCVLGGIFLCAVKSPTSIQYTTDVPLAKARGSIPEATRVFVKFYEQVKNASSMKEIEDIVESIGPLEQIEGIPCVRAKKSTVSPVACDDGEGDGDEDESEEDSSKTSEEEEDKSEEDSSKTSESSETNEEKELTGDEEDNEPLCQGVEPARKRPKTKSSDDDSPVKVRFLLTIS